MMKPKIVVIRKEIIQGIVQGLSDEEKYRSVYDEVEVAEGYANCSRLDYVTQVFLYEGIKEFSCYAQFISELRLPSTMRSLNINDNPIDKLVLNEGIENLECLNTNIKELHLPESLKKLKCNNIILTGNLDCEVNILCDDEDELIPNTSNMEGWGMPF